MNKKKILVSPMTKDVYLCSVNAKGIITKRDKLSANDMLDCIAACVVGLEDRLGSHFEFGDNELRIEIKVTDKIKDDVDLKELEKFGFMEKVEE